MALAAAASSRPSTRNCAGASLAPSKRSAYRDSAASPCLRTSESILATEPATRAGASAALQKAASCPSKPLDPNVSVRTAYLAAAAAGFA
jgi:hypothetical protein